MTAHYPVFVYGTLRPGMSNHHWFRGADANRVDATITGYELVTNGSYPYLLPASAPVSTPAGSGDTGADAPAPVVRGTLVFVDPADWETVAASLDELEGTNPAHPVHDDNLYNRVLAQVVTEAGENITAWVYIPPTHRHEELRRRHRRVPGGEWRE
ncbi:MAG: gamma-glutamylcyclotransferase family protein [Rothia sp. (in: high G+C Gram-positive bacteria)]|uniref:gamma-glutamylcyclotransferase family protein n=1 Tax=Rothia sp. (in: high G+C Gram-positive bacteria) TaxID=1885016 RepID=UPI002705A8D5|nr:gamma-glutamylcyclotransferase family protein [Rothia sp. (in: high G+C Gram-positive bacteria)]